MALKCDAYSSNWQFCFGICTIISLNFRWITPLIISSKSATEQTAGKHIPSDIVDLSWKLLNEYKRDWQIIRLTAVAWIHFFFFITKRNLLVKIALKLNRFLWQRQILFDLAAHRLCSVTWNSIFFLGHKQNTENNNRHR